MGMLLYKNIGRTVKGFYGVAFKPGEVKESPGYINLSTFVRIPEDSDEYRQFVASTKSSNRTEFAKLSDPKPLARTEPKQAKINVKQEVKSETKSVAASGDKKSTEV